LFIAAIPLFLALLVLLPVLFGSIYTSYKDIYAIADPAPEPPANRDA
jgi:hypothetical protein